MAWLLQKREKRHFNPVARPFAPSPVAPVASLATDADEGADSCHGHGSGSCAAEQCTRPMRCSSIVHRAGWSGHVGMHMTCVLAWPSLAWPAWHGAPSRNPAQPRDFILAQSSPVLSSVQRGCAVPCRQARNSKPRIFSRSSRLELLWRHLAWLLPSFPHAIVALSRDISSASHLPFFLPSFLPPSLPPSTCLSFHTTIAPQQRNGAKVAWCMPAPPRAPPVEPLIRKGPPGGAPPEKRGPFWAS